MISCKFQFVVCVFVLLGTSFALGETTVHENDLPYSEPFSTDSVETSHPDSSLHANKFSKAPAISTNLSDQTEKKLIFGMFARKASPGELRRSLLLLVLLDLVIFYVALVGRGDAMSAMEDLDLTQE